MFIDFDGYGMVIMGVMVVGLLMGLIIGMVLGVWWIVVRVFNDAGIVIVMVIYLLL